jgi:DNA mismatch repair protein MutS
VLIRTVLDLVPQLKENLKGVSSAILRDLCARIQACHELCEFLHRALIDYPPLTVTEGGMIRDGFDQELDEIRSITKDGKGWILRLQAEEIKRTGIPSLKVGYNKVFGYYIEVTNVHKDKIPKDYIRKQTLKNAERFITGELKEYEARILNAETRSKELEYQILGRIRERVVNEILVLLETGRALAELDVLSSLAKVALQNNYVCPQVDNSHVIEVIEGRHPVLERIQQTPFVPNSMYMDEKAHNILIITGPNMAGKSTYIRQGALIVLMAQIGSFVPAAKARIGVVDRVFTRIGSFDELARGASTFMVEMNEMAEILNNATPRSLIVLDEVGRGTGTFDGMAIAWAVTEYIHNNIHARTLFATHYHQLTELDKRLERVKNLHVSVREWGDQISFLYKIVPGGTDKSYGIHVARLAGIPQDLIQRARMIMSALEEMALEKGLRRVETAQLPLFVPAPAVPSDELTRELSKINPDALTPLEALQKLAELVQKAKAQR